jgi:hypothetical protein
MAKRRRKPIVINLDEFEAMCAIQATLAEMAIVFKCSEDTIQNIVKKHYKVNFSVVFRQKRQRGFISLRRTMWQTALRGNPTLLIFLAKKYLGMADRPLVETPGRALHDEQPFDISLLTDEELGQLERLVEAANSRKLLPAPGEAAAKDATLGDERTDPNHRRPD